ncbi:MAG: Holliday junction resolvase RuvX [Planctomycetota bacterium]
MPVERTLGLDYGTKRIGVAVTDPLGMLAHPLTTIENTGPEAVLEALRAIVYDKSAVRIVLGLPLNMDDSEGAAARKARAFAKTLREALQVEVELIDERLTTVDADLRLRAAGIRDWRERKKRIDQAAAAVILEDWLQQRSRQGPRGEEE